MASQKAPDERVHHKANTMKRFSEMLRRIVKKLKIIGDTSRTFVELALTPIEKGLPLLCSNSHGLQQFAFT